MKSPDSLKEIERKAYRATLDDGIYDLAFGFIFLLFAWIPVLESVGVTRYFAYAALPLVGLFAWLAKRFFTLPRLGMVEFSAKRKSRRRIPMLLAIAILLLTLPVLLMITSGGIPAGRTWFLVAVFLAPLVVTLIYAMDYPRLLIYLFVMGFAIVEAEFISSYVPSPFDSLLTFGLPGIIILGVGVVLLVRFVQKFPRQIMEVPHVG